MKPRGYTRQDKTVVDPGVSRKVKQDFVKHTWPSPQKPNSPTKKGVKQNPQQAYQALHTAAWSGRGARGGDITTRVE